MAKKSPVKLAQEAAKVVSEIENSQRVRTTDLTGKVEQKPSTPVGKAPKLGGSPKAEAEAPREQPKKTAPRTTEALRAHPAFNMRARAGSIHTPEFQGMTNLPEDLERALILLPMNALLERCGWLDAQTKYSCVKHLALTTGEDALRKFAAQEHVADERLPEAPETPEHKAIKARAEGKIAPMEGAVPKAPLIASDKMLVTKLKGKTTIQAGSLRAKVLEALSAAGGKAIEADLSKACGFSVRPVLGKLREAGWIKTEEQS